MPQYFQQENPWIGAANLVNQGGQGIGATFEQIPQARANAALMRLQALREQQQMGLAAQEAPFQIDVLKSEADKNRAEGGMYSAHGGLYSQQTQGLRDDEAVQVQLGKAAGDAAVEAMHGAISDKTMQSLADSMMQLNRKNPDAMKQLIQGLGMNSSRVGSNPQVGAQAIGIKPTVVPQNSVAYGATGNVMPGNISLRPGEQVQQAGGGVITSTVPIPAAQRQPINLSALAASMEAQGQSPQEIVDALQQISRGMANTNQVPLGYNPFNMHNASQQSPTNTITDQAGYDALPSGATYVGPDGQTRVKQ